MIQSPESSGAAEQPSCRLEIVAFKMSGDSIFSPTGS